LLEAAVAAWTWAVVVARAVWPLVELYKCK
jgi:hypothetical protein